MNHCPVCGGLLTRKGHGPEVRCGALIYYQCSACSRCYKSDQTGIMPKPVNLTEIQRLPAGLE